MRTSPSRTSERFPPRAVTGNQGISAQAPGAFNPATGVPLGFSQFSYFYGDPGLLIPAGSLFTFGLNGEVPQVDGFVGNGLNLFWSQSATPLFIPPDWMWWGSIAVQIRTDATYPSTEHWAVTEFNGVQVTQPIAGGPVSRGSGYSGTNGVRTPVIDFQAQTIDAHILQWFFQMMGIRQSIPSPIDPITG